MNRGQKMWKRATRIIPGGNMLLSKRCEMFLPEFWPSYYSKTKGCKVWDLDDNCYSDVSLMGVGTNTLGYSRSEVDEAVSAAISKGNMSTLNCPEEVMLAERLIELHPWAEMVRFSRAGGEACAIAVRIARAASGKDAVAFCGYHGWQDWYLSTNLVAGQNLDDHLLPGLEPNGVPSSLSGTALPFHYNRIEELQSIVAQNEVGVVIMEVGNSELPNVKFLKQVERLCKQEDIVLIYDEISSGFRQNLGGLHLLYDLEPDIAVYGKALGNGYPITAVIGKRAVMNAAQTSFISSTFWTDRIGPAAGLKTIETMEQIESWKTINEVGQHIRKVWKEIALETQVEIKITGIPAISSFAFQNENALTFKTYLTQEMLKRGFLASTLVYACTEHTDEVVSSYLTNLHEVFDQISEAQVSGNIAHLLQGPVCHNKFKRLN